MKLIEAYQTSDGKVFTDEKKAALHQEDILGQLLDDLLPDCDDKLMLSKNDRFSLIKKQLADPMLNYKITALYNALNYGDWNRAA